MVAKLETFDYYGTIRPIDLLKLTVFHLCWYRVGIGVGDQLAQGSLGSLGLGELGRSHLSAP